MASTSERLRTSLALVYPACMGCPLPEHLADELERDLCRGLGVRSQLAIAVSLQHWMTWWCTHGEGTHAGSASAIEAYVSAQERDRAPASSVAQRVWAINRLLKALSWPDPEAEQLVRRIQLAGWHRGCGTDCSPPSAKPLDWEQIQHIVAHTDEHSPRPVRTLAALLLLYETMARPDQIFGFKHEGRWLVPPASRQSVRRSRRGGVIDLMADSRGRGKRSVPLSEMTMAWLERSFAFWPGEDGALFRTERRTPLTRGHWTKEFRGLCKQHRLAACSPTSLRWGKTRDLVGMGVHVFDIQQAAGWAVVNTVLRVLPRSTTAKRRQHPVAYPGGGPRLPRPPPSPPGQMETGDLFGYEARP